MKKQLIIFLISSLFFMMILCGCTQENNDSNTSSNDGIDDGNNVQNSGNYSKFVGIWLENINNSGEIMTMRHTFQQDGTYTFEIININHIDNGTWTIEDNKITTITSHVNVYSYSFSDNYNKLILKEIISEEESILLKD